MKRSTPKGTNVEKISCGIKFWVPIVLTQLISNSRVIDNYVYTPFKRLNAYGLNGLCPN